MKEIERAINLISEGEIDYSGIYDCELNERVTEVILHALREQAERQKGCVWCNENNKVFHDGQHFHLFCSYCGKRLEVEP